MVIAFSIVLSNSLRSKENWNFGKNLLKKLIFEYYFHRISFLSEIESIHDYRNHGLSADQRSASYPGLNPKSLDIISCSSIEFTNTSGGKSRNPDFPVSPRFENPDFPVSPRFGNTDFPISPICLTPTSPYSPGVIKPDVGIISPMTKTFRYLNAFDFNETSIEDHTSNISGQRSPSIRNKTMHLLSPNGVIETGVAPMTLAASETNNNYLRTNTFSLHADTSVTVRGSRSSSIRSRTSFALMINGEAIGASACLGKYISLYVYCLVSPIISFRVETPGLETLHQLYPNFLSKSFLKIVFHNGKKTHSPGQN